MERRTFLAMVPGCLLAAPVGAEAQPAGRTVRIGVLSFGDPEPFREGFRQAVGELGYAEGRNAAVEYRSANGQTDRLVGLATELVRLNVDVLVAGTTPSIQAAMTATRTIPIVMAAAGDALGTGLVTNLARPGGNVTGLSLALIQLAGKTVALLREAAPSLRGIACIVHRDDPLHRGFLREAELSAARIGFRFQSHVLKSSAELGGVLTELGRDTAIGVIFQPIFVVDPHVRARTVQLVRANRLPSVSGLRRFAEAGGLVAYASEFDDLPRRAASYAHKILNGKKAGDLPVEQPTKFQLVINLKAAKELGMTIPRALLQRADQVIE
jgi:putative ABC transport system substrate-binding protein